MAVVSNDKIYELINATRLELKKDIGDLRDDFQKLEEGRLTRLEGQVSDMRVNNIERDSRLSEKQAIVSTKVVVIFTIGYIVLTALMTAIFTGAWKWFTR